RRVRLRRRIPRRSGHDAPSRPIGFHPRLAERARRLLPGPRPRCSSRAASPCGRKTLLSVSTASRRHADLMSDVKGTVLDAIIDAVTGGSGAATSFAALVVASFLLGACLLAT